jgi:hypothetical protein
VSGGPKMRERLARFVALAFTLAAIALAAWYAWG